MLCAWGPGDQGARGSRDWGIVEGVGVAAEMRWKNWVAGGCEEGPVCLEERSGGKLWAPGLSSAVYQPVLSTHPPARASLSCWDDVGPICTWWEQGWKVRAGGA